MFSVVTSGLPISARDILSKAVELEFGSGVVDLVELNKDDLRSRVRLSKRDFQVILVVLDGVASDICRDIENGLYSTDKYHTYIDDKDLVNFLNNKYKLSLEVPEDVPEVISKDFEEEGISTEIIERYEAQLRDRDLMITSLEARIEELNEIIESEDFSTVSEEELDEIKNKLDLSYKENLELRDKLLSYENSISEKDRIIFAFKEEKKELEDSLGSIKKSKESLLSEYRSLNSELTSLRVENSKQVALIKSKTAEIKALQENANGVETLKDSLKTLENVIAEKDKEISNLSVKSSNLSVDLSSKCNEIERLTEEIRQNGITSEMVESLKSDLSSITTERDDLIKQLSAKESIENESRGELESAVFKVDKLTRENKELKNKIEEYDTDLATLNEEKLRLSGEIRVLKQSVDRDVDLESVSAELMELRGKYNSLSKGIFGRISATSMPKGSSTAYLLSGDRTYKNIRFAFAGSTESRKGAYRSLLNEFRQFENNERVLIVDVVSETYVDYVFEIKSVVNGLEWFRKGGGVQPYLSKTCLKNVSVLSPGVGYVNDSYFLTIDWERRLSELENSGYNVVVFCGDISNIIGRVMHESFASYGNSYIYIHGNVNGARTIVANLMGISNAKDSVVAYFDYNDNIKRFYDMVSRNNKCLILSKLSRR